jgi:hypothetical protein
VERGMKVRRAYVGSWWVGFDHGCDVVVAGGRCAGRGKRLVAFGVAVERILCAEVMSRER